MTRVVDMSKRKKGPQPPPTDPPDEPPAQSPTPDGTSSNTDMRFALRLGDWHRHELRYCAPWGCWLAWDDKRWARQSGRGGTEQEAAKKTAKRLMQEAQGTLKKARTEVQRLEGQRTADGAPTPAFKAAQQEVEKGEAGVKGAKRAQSADAIRNMLRLASTDPRLAITPDELDRWPWALNVANGTVDLRSGELLPHNLEELHTKIAPVHYLPDAKAPKWEAFLQEVMPDPEMRRYLQKLAGYSFTGSTREQCLHFHFGGGANGKSVFLRTLLEAAGDYGVQAPRNLLFASKQTQHDTRFAALHGARLVLCNEIEDGLQFDESLVKDMCSEDRLSCRRMREDFWSFSPTHKLHVAGQHKPHIQGDDEGIWRRLRLTPWTVTIPKERRDKALLGKLWEERSGILAWIVRGAVLWMAEGLEQPEAIVSATAEYRENSDIAGQFLREMVGKDTKSQVSVAEFRKAYEKFCEDLGSYALGAQRFNARLRAFGAATGSTRVEGAKVKTWRGVRLL